jgi:phage regulator Rha-like protein
MSSREIAELTGKRHDHVLRDIDNLIETLPPDLGTGFQTSTYLDANGQERRQFLLDRDSTYCLVAGYDPAARMRIIKRWQELETPKTPGEALVEMAQTFLRHERRMAALEAEHQALAVQQQETAAKVRAIADGDGFFAVAAYANLRHQPIDNQLAALLGKRASAICRARGLPVGRARHPLWGEVNTYHADVLDAVFAEVTGKPA